MNQLNHVKLVYDPLCIHCVSTIPSKVSAKVSAVFVWELVQCFWLEDAEIFFHFIKGLSC